ncbi:MAG: phosphotransferase, partial [Paracoccaceae bacterium]|nr:phosphotransferase [Paracoccaceae bacterium]
ATDAMVLPEGFARPSWDEVGLLGPEPFWGRFWENPALTSAETGLLQTARVRAMEKLAIYRAAGADYGLIHADLMRENILVDGARVWLIDFDDCGFGFRLYDLATLMLQNLGEPAYPDLVQAALDGYGAVRPLGATDVALLPMFVMLRCFASCGWAVPRMAQADPKLRFYAERALQQARLFLEGA